MAESNDTKVSEHASTSKLLYIDILNYLDNFFNIWEWDIQIASRKVKRFISAATRSDWGLKIFIDASIESEEAIAKWRKRREREVLEFVKDMPQGSSTLIGDLFSAQGVEVLYSNEKDNDDTIAFHAVADGADVLSGDRDFFRYEGANYRVFKSFKIISGKLLLQEYEISQRHPRGANVRILEAPPPVSTRNPLFTSTDNYAYRRGVPSPLVRLLGNPHITARPLRRAMYARLAFDSEILEEFPVWDREVAKPVWDLERVVPDSEWDYLLDDPIGALLRVYSCQYWPPPKPHYVYWNDFDKHVFAMEMIVFEICVRANGNEERLSDKMLKLSSLSRSKPHRGKK